MVLDGVVVRGKQLGRTLDFPTANIEPTRIQGDWPANGVYAAAVWIGGDPLARLAMLNQGVHPTAPEGKPTIEAHLIGWSGDLYGASVRVEYLKFLRPERRFESLDALKAQLNRDRTGLTEWFESAPVTLHPDASLRRRMELQWHKIK